MALVKLSKQQLSALAENDLIDLTDEEIQEIEGHEVPESLVKMADQIINDGVGKIKSRTKAETLNGLDAITKNFEPIVGKEEFERITSKYAGKTYQIQNHLITAVNKKIEALSKQQSNASASGNDDKADALQAKIDELEGMLENGKTEVESKLTQKEQEFAIERSYDKAFMLAARSDVFTAEELNGKYTEDNFLKELKATVKEMGLQVSTEGKLVKEDGKPKSVGGKNVEWADVIQKAKENGGWGKKSATASSGSFHTQSREQGNKTPAQLALEKTFGVPR